MIYPTLHNDLEKAVTTHAQHFDSLQQFTSQAHALYTDTAPADMQERNPSKCEYFDRAQEFNGNIDGYQFRDNTFKRVANEDTRKRIHATPLQVSPQATQAPLEVVDLYHDEEGMFLDSTAYFNGDEFNMVSMEFQQQTKPIVYLCASFIASAKWEDIHFINRGIALIKAVHALEKQGVSVGVIAYSVCQMSDTKSTKDQRSINTVIVKAPQNALDESDLINALTTSSMARTCGFQNIYYQLGYHSDSLGRPHTLTKEDIKHAAIGDVEMMVLPYDHKHSTNFESIEGADALIKQYINEQTTITI